MLETEMHDSDNGSHSANRAETLVLTPNNLVYPEPSSTYFNIDNHNHQHHNHFHRDDHHNHYHPLSNFDYQNSQYHDTITQLNSVQQNQHAENHSNSNDLSLFQNQIRPLQEAIDNNHVDDDEEGDDEDDDDDNDEDDDDDDDEDNDEDEEEEKDDEDDDEDESGDEDEDDDDDEDEDEDESEKDIVDPGQHCQINQDQHHQPIVFNNEFMRNDDSAANDILDGERMLEVTRKLVRNTERDPDRDLRKQVLLKTAIKKLPHFMEYNRYSDNLDRSFHNNMSPQAYYEHHDSQQKFYHSVQPNAIQMSTTSLRMLDLNDDQDPEMGALEHEIIDPNLAYNRTGLEQHDCSNQHQYDRYHNPTRAHELNHCETSNPIISRHNSIDNLYQPVNTNDINVEIKDTGSDERIPITFQIACEIYDFTCTPEDGERKILDNLTNSYYAKSTKESRTVNSPVDCGGEDGTDLRDADGSDTSSSSHSSSDESANSLVSQSNESDETGNEGSLLEASLNTSNEFYHSSHDSGVALFNTRSNKRSSSSIGLDDDMDIDHLTELSSRGQNSFVSSNQYKKLRKREIVD